MKRSAVAFPVILMSLFISTSAQSAIVADCGASVGTALYLGGKEPGWTDDRISTGRFLFDVNEKDNWNVLFKDSRGKIFDSVAERAVVVPTQTNKTRTELILVVAYPGAGVTETYSFTEEKAGRRILLWTANKFVLEGVGLTKIGAYKAVCQ